MRHKIPFRFRTIMFAAIMSCSTALIVSGIIIYLHSESREHFIAQWLGAFISAWPIVFVAILLIAPIVNKLLDQFVDFNQEL